MYQADITKRDILYQSSKYMFVTELGIKYKESLVFLGIGLTWTITLRVGRIDDGY
jgi:hypothetical protein